VSPWQKWSLHGLILVNAGSGVAYLWMRYFIDNTDPFSVINHPLEPVMLQAHLLSAPLLLVVFGVVFQSHVAQRIGEHSLPNRRSGWLSFLTFGLMTFSGVLLQTLTDPILLRVTLIVHLASSGLFVIGYITHLCISVRLLRTTSRPPVWKNVSS